MLPAAHRMRHSRDFDLVMRSGTRARTGTVVVHRASLTGPPPTGSALTGSAPTGSAGAADPGLPVARAGLIVAKSVGGSVVRHRTARRLRAQLAGRITRLAPGSGIVVRALPAAGSASSDRLGADLDRALNSLDRLTPDRRGSAR